MSLRPVFQAARAVFSSQSAGSRVGSGWHSRFRGLGRQMVHGWAKSALIFGSINAFMAEPGSMVSAMAGGTAELFGLGYIAGIALTGNPVAAVGAAFLVDPYIGGQIRKGMQAFSRFEQINNFTRNQMSAGMLQAAWTMRQAAARDMAGSLINARQWLGKEAAFYHG